jgi:type II secretory pathway pseudopilin PulG
MKPRNAFTMIEMSVATGMMALLALLVSYSWQSLGKATVNLIARVQITQEMDFAVAAISHDLGGCVVNSQGTATFPFNNLNPSITSPTTSGTATSIQWELDNGDKVTYELENSPETSSTEWKHNLVRRYYANSDKTSTKFTVARNVDSIKATWENDNQLAVEIVFSCNYKTLNKEGKQDRTQSILKRACKLVTNQPSPKEI